MWIRLSFSSECGGIGGTVKREAEAFCLRLLALLMLLKLYEDLFGSKFDLFPARRFLYSS